MKTPRITRKLALPLALVFALAATSGLTLAQRFGGGPQGPPEPGLMLERMTQHLELTPDQTEALEQLFNTHRESVQADRQLLRDARQALADRIHAEAFDELAIRDAAASVAVLQAEQAVARGAFLQEIRGVLTPDQQAKLEESMQMRREMRKGRGHGRHGGGHGQGHGQGPQGQRGGN